MAAEACMDDKNDVSKRQPFTSHLLETRYHSLELLSFGRQSWINSAGIDWAAEQGRLLGGADDEI